MLAMEPVSTDFPEINARVSHSFFQKGFLIDHMLLFENDYFRHYSIQTLKILLQHLGPSTTV